MSNESGPVVLFIGLGAMGRPMAFRMSTVARLVVADNDETAAQAAAAESRAKVAVDVAYEAAQADLVVLSLPNSAAVESVLIDNGILDAMNPSTAIVDLSSSRPASTADLAQKATERRVGYIDAPVSGGVVKAHSGELSIMVGASTDEALQQARPVLEAIGAKITVTGKSGAGHAMKALNNALSAIGILGASEVVAAASKYGIAPETAVDVLNSSTGRVQSTEVKFKPYILSGTYDAGYAMELMIKDIGLALEIVQSEQTPHALISSAVDTIREIFTDLTDSDPSIRRDHTEIARWVSERADTNLTSPA